MIFLIKIARKSRHFYRYSKIIFFTYSLCLILEICISNSDKGRYHRYFLRKWERLAPDFMIISMTRDQLQPRGRDIGFMDARGLPAWVSSSLECACVPWKSAFLASVGGLLPPSPRSNSITDRMNLYLRGYGWVKVVRRRVQRGSWSQNWSFNYVRTFHKTCSKETYEWKWLRSDENFHAKKRITFFKIHFLKRNGKR